MKKAFWLATRWLVPKVVKFVRFLNNPTCMPRCDAYCPLCKSLCLWDGPSWHKPYNTRHHPSLHSIGTHAKGYVTMMMGIFKHQPFARAFSSRHQTFFFFYFCGVQRSRFIVSFQKRIYLIQPPPHILPSDNQINLFWRSGCFKIDGCYNIVRILRRLLLLLYVKL